MRTGFFQELNNEFSYQIQQLRNETHADIYSLSFQSACPSQSEVNDTVSGEWFLPAQRTENSPPIPTIIILHMFSANFCLIKPICRQLCRNGVSALMLYLPHAGPRAENGARKQLRRDASFFLKMFAQACADTDRTCQILLQQPCVSRVDLMGVSLGGLIAATTAGKNPLYCRLMLLVTGGDLRGIMKKAFLARNLSKAFEKSGEKEQQLLLQDLHQIEPLLYAGGLAARAASGNVLMVNGAYDKVIPPENALMLANAIGLPDPGRANVLHETLLSGSAFRLQSPCHRFDPNAPQALAPTCAEPLHWLASGHYSTVLYMPPLLRLTADFFASPSPGGI